jgi:hypothetical protein
MDLVTTLLCEYIIEENECIEYLRCIDVKYKYYEHVYTDYDYYRSHISNKKKIRSLNIMCASEDFGCVDLTEYTNLMRVYFDKMFSDEIIFPNSVVLIDMYVSHYEQEILRFPPGLIYLYLNDTYNHKLPELTKLRELHVGNNYNHEIKLSHTLTYLSWINGNDIPALPHGLTHLVLGIDKPIVFPKNLPNTLTHLTISDCDSVSHIPETITHLVWDCDQQLPILHDKLIYLSIREDYDNKINKLPNSLTHLLINCNIEIDHIPPKLMYLKWISNSKFPNIVDTELSSLEYLIVGVLNNRQDYTFWDEKIPSGLKHLKWLYNEKLPPLPRSLCTLILDSRYCHKIIKLPPKLTYLRGYCTQRLPKLPKTLITLKLHNYKYKFKSFPRTLTTLELHCDYEYKLPKIPKTIHRIVLSNNYKYLDKLRKMYHDKVIIN